MENGVTVLHLVYVNCLKRHIFEKFVWLFKAQSFSCRTSSSIKCPNKAAEASLGRKWKSPPPLSWSRDCRFLVHSQSPSSSPPLLPHTSPPLAPPHTAPAWAPGCPSEAPSAVESGLDPENASPSTHGGHICLDFTEAQSKQTNRTKYQTVNERIVKRTSESFFPSQWSWAGCARFETVSHFIWVLPSFKCKWIFLSFPFFSFFYERLSNYWHCKIRYSEFHLVSKSVQSTQECGPICISFLG